MTVIAWDGQTLAADKRGVHGSLIVSVTKIFKIRNHLIGVSGDIEKTVKLKQWFIDGCPAKEYPYDKDKYATLMVITPSKKIHMFYDNSPYHTLVEDAFYAAGSGRDYALAAMSLGETAGGAVQVACNFDPNCGNGIDELELGK